MNNTRLWWHSGAACLAALMWALFAAFMLIAILGIGNRSWTIFTAGIVITVAVFAMMDSRGERKA